MSPPIVFPPRLRPWANPRFLILNFLKESQIPHYPTLLPDLYAGFRHPDRMAPEQTVRGGEKYCSIWSGNFLTYVPKFSRIFPKPGIFRRFPWSSVREVTCPCRYFTFLEECKIPVWTLDKLQNVPESKGGFFAFPEVQFSRGEHHFE